MTRIVHVMISVAAERAGMHPQTLRMYEARGLVSPSRSTGNTRLYSHADILRLQRIQELSSAGVNLAGIERILRLEARLADADSELNEIRGELGATRAYVRQIRRQLLDALSQVESLTDRKRD